MNAVLDIHARAWLFGAGFLVLAGCAPATNPAPGREEPSAVPAAAAVVTVKPVRKTMTRKIEQPGEIRAFAQTPILVRISGYVAKVYKDIGDPVHEGELLAELAVPEMHEELGLKQAEVAVAQAKIGLAKQRRGAAEADLESASAKVKEAQARRLRVTAESRRAESMLVRFEKSTSVLTGENLDEARLGVAAARAAVAEVEAKIGSAEAARLSAAANRDTAQAEVKLAEASHTAAQAEARRMAALVKYAKLSAPFAGVVTWRNVDPGWFVQPGAGKGEAVFIVASIDPVRVFVDVPERDAVAIQDGMAATVRVQALAGATFQGTVKRTAWSLDPKERTLRTEIDLKNADGKLRPGMYVYSVITVEHPNVWTVPASTVVTQGEQTFCYLVAKGQAIRTPVRVGFRDAQSIEVNQKRTPGPQERWDDFTKDDAVVVNAAAVSDGQAVQAAHTP